MELGIWLTLSKKITISKMVSRIDAVMIATLATIETIEIDVTMIVVILETLAIAVTQEIPEIDAILETLVINVMIEIQETLEIDVMMIVTSVTSVIAAIAVIQEIPEILVIAETLGTPEILEILVTAVTRERVTTEDPINRPTRCPPLKSKSNPTSSLNTNLLTVTSPRIANKTKTRSNSSRNLPTLRSVLRVSPLRLKKRPKVLTLESRPAECL